MACKHEHSKVIDSRERRRRRVYDDCQERFSTYEVTPEDFESVRRAERIIKTLKTYITNIKL